MIKKLSMTVLLILITFTLLMFNVYEVNAYNYPNFNAFDNSGIIIISSDSIEFIEGSIYLEVYIPPLSIFAKGLNGFDGYHTKLSFCTTLCTDMPYWYFEEWLEDDGRLILNLDAIQDLGGIYSDILDSTSFYITYVLNDYYPYSYAELDSELLTFLNDTFSYAFDSELELNVTEGIYTVTYMDRGVEYFNVSYSTVPTKPPTPYREGYTLVWKTESGEFYNFDDELLPQVINSFSTTLTAVWYAGNYIPSFPSGTHFFNTSFQTDSGVWIIDSLMIPIPAETTYMEVFIHPLNVIAKEHLGEQTKLYFCRTSFICVSMNYEQFSEYLEPDGRLILDLEAIQDLGGIYSDVLQSKAFSLRYVLNLNYPYEYIDIDSEFISFLNTTFTFAFDSELVLKVSSGEYTVHYFDRFIPIMTITYSDIPTKPPTPYRFGHVFLGWYTLDGELYEFDEFLESSSGRVTSLRAGWRSVNYFDSDVNYTVNIPTIINDVLSIIGFNTAFGRTLIYFIFITVITVLLLLLKIKAIALVLVIFIMSGLFMIMGWLPLYVAVVIGGSLVVGLIMTVKGGMN